MRIRVRSARLRRRRVDELRSARKSYFARSVFELDSRDGPDGYRARRELVAALERERQSASEHDVQRRRFRRLSKRILHWNSWNRAFVHEQLSELDVDTGLTVRRRRIQRRHLGGLDPFRAPDFVHQSISVHVRVRPARPDGFADDGDAHEIPDRQTLARSLLLAPLAQSHAPNVRSNRPHHLVPVRSFLFALRI